LSAPEREVTSPSDLKIVGALGLLHRDITELLLKVALSTITLTLFKNACGPC
jgi:hypothetical protein